MNFIYGVIYYLLLCLLILFCSLIIFCIRPIRRIFFTWARNTPLVINPLGGLPFAILVLLIFTIIDSTSSYIGSNSQILSLGRFQQPQFDSPAAIKQFKNYRIAQRNLMLTVACLVVALILKKFVDALIQLNEMENMIQKLQQELKQQPLGQHE